MGYFKKSNSLADSDALLCEAQGLQLLRLQLAQTASDFIQIPKLYTASQEQLIMARVESSSATSQQWYQCGQALAQLHRLEFADYGFEQDNYIGLNPQKNTLSNNWGEFFFEYRLLFQLGLIKDAQVRDEFSQMLLKKKQSLIDFLNQTCAHPSLVHGDLWSGNLLFDANHAWLIDPAAYYGDREVDLAMTEMFGGFAPEFYQGYDSVYPRSKYYTQKKQIYNLYHYLNHYNLFGDGYLSTSYSYLKNI